ncbi:hypothetical protein NPX13_g9001 [Xylaria arbuscula]|uniref:Uncharacterized protein n=1 Tax=Xylaria arbuscula TaxID=114810 RepID=A0A9W8TJL2_9PEZI|nr:hypothetical protein NPX13_g9001 [Xylaria arbuscula]
MSFGVTKSIPESQTVLQLQWDCRQNKGVACQLINSWIAGTDGTILNEEERRTIAETLRMETSEVTRKVESLLRINLVHFERVRSQLLSLLIGWEQVIQEKEQYDQERLYIRREEDKAGLSPREFMILFQIIYYRAQAGLTILPVLTSDSAGPTNIYLPTEIWHTIATWLDPLDIPSFLVTHKGASGAFTRRQLQHTRLWTTIFKNDSWISKVLSHGFQPVILGCQLDNICGYMILAFAGDVLEIPDILRDPNCRFVHKTFL